MKKAAWFLLALAAILILGKAAIEIGPQATAVYVCVLVFTGMAWIVISDANTE